MTGCCRPRCAGYKQLEEENAKLKKLVADLSLDKEMLQDVIPKAMKPGEAQAGRRGVHASGGFRSARPAEPLRSTGQPITTNLVAPARLQPSQLVCGETPARSRHLRFVRTRPLHDPLCSRAYSRSLQAPDISSRV